MSSNFNTNLITKFIKNNIFQTALDVILNRSSDKFNTNLTTRYDNTGLAYTNLTTRLFAYDVIPPKNLHDIIVYNDGVELVDVDYSTLRIQLNLNSTPSNASFILARKHDDLDRTILGVASEITAENKITVYDGSILLFTGYISKINAISSTDTVEVIAEDIRCKMADETVSLYYGGYSARQISEQSISTVYFTISEAISYVLSVAGVSGSLGISFVPEPTYYTGNCAAILDTLVGSSINANWYIDENENFQIQRVALGTIKTLPLSSTASKRGIYETILNDVSLNKLTSFYSPSIRVKYGKIYTTIWSSWAVLHRNYKLEWNKLTAEYTTDTAQSEIEEDLNYVKGLMFTKQEQQIFIIQKNKYTGNTVNLDSYFVDTGFYSGQSLVSATYQAQYKAQDSILDITPVVIGSGEPQRDLDLSQFGKRVANGQLTTKEIGGVNYLGYQYVETYDYTAFALDLANYELNQNNKLLTEASISLILDAYEYYGINLSNLLNLSNTTISNIYNNTNGFPLNISSVTIDCATRIVAINASNYGKSFYQRSSDYRTNYSDEIFYAVWQEYVPTT